MKACLSCGENSLPDELHFCPKCGANLDSQAAYAADNSIKTPMIEHREITYSEDSSKIDGQAEKKSENKKRIKKRKTIMRLIILFIAAIISAAVVLFVLFKIGIKKEQEPIVYLKDSAAQYIDDKVEAPVSIREVKLTANFPNVAFAKNALNRFVFVNESDTAFSDNFYALTFADSQKTEDGYISVVNEPVMSYGISSDGKTVWYVNRDGELYLHDLKSRRILATDVFTFKFNDDFSYCAYTTNAGELYCISTKEGAQKVKVENDVFIIDLFSSKYVVYEKTPADDKSTDKMVIYNVRSNEKNEYENAEIAASFEDNSCFYFLAEGDESAIEIVDSKAADDAKWVVEEGEKSEYGYPAGEWYYWYSFYETQNRDEVKGEQSLMTRKDYMEYSSRQALRKILEEYSGMRTSSLYYFDGKTARLVDSGVVKAVTPDKALNSSAALIYEKIAEGSKKISIDELAKDIEGKVKAIEYADEDGGTHIELTYLGDTADEAAQNVSAQVKGIVNSSFEYRLAQKTEITKTGIGGGELASDIGSQFFSAKSSAAGDMMYLLNTDLTSYTMNLYEKEAVSGSAAKLVKSGVTAMRVYDWGYVYSVPEEEDPSAVQLFSGNGKIDNKVELSTVTVSKSQCCIYYLKAFDGLSGELYCYKDGNAVLIAERVHAFTVIDGGRVLALREYNSKLGKGELYLYTADKKERLLDSGVSDIASALSSEYSYYAVK
ncbi:MAG: hypothetical protein RSD08_05310 [Oscillospiraceae bacterium]